MAAVLTQINISGGGMPKTPVLLARVTWAGLEGDRQTHTKVHGGPNRAICLYSEELYAWLRSEGVDVQPGDIGENFTTRGLDYQSLSSGDRLRGGECVIEITKVREPCNLLNKWHPRLLQIIKGRSGWLAKVIEEGNVRPGDAVVLIKETQPTAEKI